MGGRSDAQSRELTASWEKSPPPPCLSHGHPSVMRAVLQPWGFPKGAGTQPWGGTTLTAPDPALSSAALRVCCSVQAVDW